MHYPHNTKDTKNLESALPQATKEVIDIIWKIH